MNGTYYRSEMYYADMGAVVGREEAGIRPVVIIQNDVGNKHSPTVIVAPITTKNGGCEKLPTHCHIDAKYGLSAPSLVLLEQIRVMDKSRLGRYIGTLPPKVMSRLDRALSISIGLI